MKGYDMRMFITSLILIVFGFIIGMLLHKSLGMFYGSTNPDVERGLIIAGMVLIAFTTNGLMTITIKKSTKPSITALIVASMLLFLIVFATALLTTCILLGVAYIIEKFFVSELLTPTFISAMFFASSIGVYAGAGYVKEHAEEKREKKFEF